MPRVFAIAALIFFAVTVSANERERGALRMMEGAEHALGADRFVARSSALVSGPVAGDLFAAGGEVDVVATVGGDAVLAGGRVRLDAAAGQDLYAAGGRVSLNAPLVRNARIAGGSVLIGPRARIGGGASIAAGKVDLLGAVDGYLQVAAGRVFIDAPVAGDVEAIGRTIELGPNARIAGRLRYASRQDLMRHADAQVGGGVERFALDLDLEDKLPVKGFVVALYWVWIAGLMVLGAVLVAALPQHAARIAGDARRRFGWSVLLGFVALVVIPAATVAIAVTGIGVPLALLLVLCYLGLLLVGYVTAGIALGAAALERWSAERAKRTGWRAAAAAAAILLIALFAWVPFLGALVAFVALLVGMGAILLQLRRTLPQP